MPVLEIPPAAPQLKPRPAPAHPSPAIPPPSGPVPSPERLVLLDVLRGFALLGILLVNMALFNHSFVAQVIGLDRPTGLLDQLARWVIAFFAEGKFYSTFAFLFGLGMALQHRRFVAGGRRFAPFFLRRMGVLLLIGLAHAYLLWVGDILILYSLLGVVLLLAFRNRRPRTLLVWFGVLLLLPLLLNSALFGLAFLARATPEGAAMVDAALAEQQAQLSAAAAQADQAYASGSYLQVTAQRARDMQLVFATWPFMAFNVLAMMVLGVYAAQRDLANEAQGSPHWLRRLWRWSLAIGVIGNLLYVVAGDLASRSVPSPQLLASLVGQTVGAPALSIFYMTSIARLQDPAWQARLAPLASVGRMAISNYLLQTIICTTLFYGYGLGLYGRVGPAAGVLLTVAIYAAQVPLSVWWLRRFRFGPVEWLWRTLSYGRRQPMRLEG